MRLISRIVCSVLAVQTAVGPMAMSVMAGKKGGRVPASEPAVDLYFNANGIDPNHRDITMPGFMSGIRSSLDGHIRLSMTPYRVLTGRDLVSSVDREIERQTPEERSARNVLLLEATSTVAFRGFVQRMIQDAAATRGYVTSWRPFHQLLDRTILPVCNAARPALKQDCEQMVLKAKRDFVDGLAAQQQYPSMLLTPKRTGKIIVSPANARLFETRAGVLASAKLASLHALIERENGNFNNHSDVRPSGNWGLIAPLQLAFHVANTVNNVGSASHACGDYVAAARYVSEHPEKFGYDQSTDMMVVRPGASVSGDAHCLASAASIVAASSGVAQIFANHPYLSQRVEADTEIWRDVARALRSGHSVASNLGKTKAFREIAQVGGDLGPKVSAAMNTLANRRDAGLAARLAAMAAEAQPFSGPVSDALGSYLDQGEDGPRAASAGRPGIDPLEEAVSAFLAQRGDLVTLVAMLQAIDSPMPSHLKAVALRFSADQVAQGMLLKAGAASELAEQNLARFRADHANALGALRYGTQLFETALVYDGVVSLPGVARQLGSATRGIALRTLRNIRPVALRPVAGLVLRVAVELGEVGPAAALQRAAIGEVFVPSTVDRAVSMARTAQGGLTLTPAGVAASQVTLDDVLAAMSSERPLPPVARAPSPAPVAPAVVSGGSGGGVYSLEDLLGMERGSLGAGGASARDTLANSGSMPVEYEVIGAGPQARPGVQTQSAPRHTVTAPPPGTPVMASPDLVDAIMDSGRIATPLDELLEAESAAFRVRAEAARAQAIAARPATPASPSASAANNGGTVPPASARAVEPAVARPTPQPALGTQTDPVMATPPPSGGATVATLSAASTPTVVPAAGLNVLIPGTPERRIQAPAGSDANFVGRQIANAVADEVAVSPSIPQAARAEMSTGIRTCQRCFTDFGGIAQTGGFAPEVVVAEHGYGVSAAGSSLRAGAAGTVATASVTVPAALEAFGNGLHGLANTVTIACAERPDSGPRVSSLEDDLNAARANRGIASKKSKSKKSKKSKAPAAHQ